MLLTAILLTFSGLAQNKTRFTEEDAEQFYRTIQGDYTVVVNDSTSASAHFIPIWENQGNRFQWLYLEVVMDEETILQKVLELQPKTDKQFRVCIYDLKKPEQFVGKWGNRNYFDGFNTSIIKGGKRLTFVKTSDFSYQMHKIMRVSAIDCFPKGDLLHFKFVQEDERFYVKRIPKGTSRIIGYQGLKELTD